ncbi:MAG: hypothetical protein ACI9OU_001675 [Candidatus Promineifilaceae bacterium]|jgi:hypothetical protein
MDPNTLIGLVIVVVAVTTICCLVFWSYRTIERIADKRLQSVRDIVRDLNDER